MLHDVVVRWQNPSWLVIRRDDAALCRNAASRQHCGSPGAENLRHPEDQIHLSLRTGFTISTTKPHDVNANLHPVLRA
jgi:hypothetical protein